MKPIILLSDDENHDNDKDEGLSKFSGGCCSQKYPNLDHLLGYICEDSTVHGVKFLGYKYLHIVERVFWAIAVLAGIGLAVYLVQTVFQKYNDTPVIISFEPKETSISQIPFPAITICNVNMMKRSVIQDTYDKVNLAYAEALITQTPPQNHSGVRDGVAMMSRITQYCLSAQSFRRKLNAAMVDASGTADILAVVNKIFLDMNDTTAKLVKYAEEQAHISKLTQQMFRKAFPRCEDMVLKCFWASDEISCVEHFYPIETRHGHCCVYNFMPKFVLQNVSKVREDKMKKFLNMSEEAIQQWRDFRRSDIILPRGKSRRHPIHQKAGGKPYGLSILLNPELNEYSTCTTHDSWGFKIIAHSPVSAPSVEDFAAAVPPGSEVFVDLEASVTLSEESLMNNIDLEKRGCILESDEQVRKLKYYNYYSAENCVDECLARETFRACQCVRYSMPRSPKQKICGTPDRECAENVRMKSRTNWSMCAADCRPSCTEIKYKMQLSQFDLRESSRSTSNVTYLDVNGEEQLAKNYSILHIYFGAHSVYPKKRKSLYDIGALIGNAGGLLNLALGVSMLSFVELIYFCTMRAFFLFWDQKKENDADHDHDDYDDDEYGYKNEMHQRKNENENLSNYNSNLMLRVKRSRDKSAETLYDDSWFLK